MMKLAQSLCPISKLVIDMVPRYAIPKAKTMAKKLHAESRSTKTVVKSWCEECFPIVYC